MKNYIITVNGTKYEVVVEEKSANNILSNSETSKRLEDPTPTIVSDSSKGSIEIKAPMAGKILSIKKSISDSVKKGDVLLILEAMKMENEIVASNDGVIASIDVNVGQSVDSSQILVTLN